MKKITAASNKKLTEAINYSLDWIAEYDAPDGPWLYDHVKDGFNLEAILACIKLSARILKKRKLEKTMGFICRIPVTFPRDNYDFKYAGWQKVKPRLDKLLKLSDARITFYNFKESFSRIEKFDPEFYRILANDAYTDINHDGFNFYYIESRDDVEYVNGTGEYSRYLYIIEAA